MMGLYLSRDRKITAQHDKQRRRLSIFLFLCKPNKGQSWRGQGQNRVAVTAAYFHFFVCLHNSPECGEWSV